MGAKQLLRHEAASSRPCWPTRPAALSGWIWAPAARPPARTPLSGGGSARRLDGGPSSSTEKQGVDNDRPHRSPAGPANHRKPIPARTQCMPRLAPDVEHTTSGARSLCSLIIRTVGGRIAASTWHRRMVGVSGEVDTDATNHRETSDRRGGLLHEYVRAA